MKRKIDLKDIYNIVYVSDSQISPDGKYTAFVKMNPDKEKNCYTSTIWITGEDIDAQCITDKFEFSTFPRWAPDGDSLLFSSVREGVSQLYRYFMETKTLEGLTTDITSKGIPSWSPDGKKIAYVSTCSSKRTTESIKVSTMVYKSDDVSGLLDLDADRYISILDLETMQTTRVTPEGFTLENPLFAAVLDPRWSPDGTKLVFVSKVQDALERDIDPWKAGLYIAEADGSGVRNVKRTAGPAVRPLWSPDGQSIIYTGNQNEMQRATTQRLCSLDIQEGQQRYLTDNFDRNVGDFTDFDAGVGYSDANHIIDEASKKVYFLAVDEGRVSIFSIDLEDRNVECVIGGDRCVYGFSMSKDRKKIAFCYSNPEIPADIGVLNLDTGRETRLTNVNDSFLDEVTVSVPMNICLDTVDDMKMNGWTLKPYDCKPDSKYPAVLNIHGGPNLQYGWGFSFEAQVYSANGYAVIYCNPRGSRGCGQKFTAAIRGDFGGLDFNDIMRFTDKALEAGFIDADRLAVMGFSYGGFMTNWIASHTDRFSAAVSQAGVSNWMTMFGISDFGFMVNELLGIGEIENLTNLWDISPLAYAENVNTPMLFIHGERDMRCPIDQSEQLFVRLKSLGKKSEFARFPQSSHHLYSLDPPAIYVERISYVLEYYRRYV